MSADNGVYILETTGPEYRVACLQAIENIDWDPETCASDADEDTRIANARKMFSGARAFTDRSDAITYAFALADEYPFLEYGVSDIKVDRPWSGPVMVAK